ncbi:BRO family protein [Embleya scabrispora]|uniref:BRO family protein n=1 Tax=Embleya scabrispora TaxID=159449 RepID=UPI003CCBFC51
MGERAEPFEGQEPLEAAGATAGTYASWRPHRASGSRKPQQTAAQRGSVSNPYGTSDPHGNPNMTFISEAGAYSLILRSNKRTANPFRRRPHR